MDMTATYLDTEVLDLADVPLADLRQLSAPGWARSADRLVQQAQRPRTNFGGTGPPGRAD
jgi:hypothetical protein